LENPELFFKDVMSIGFILNDQKRAKDIVAFYQSRLEVVRKGLAGIKETEKPRVLLLNYTDRGGGAAVQVPAKSWMQTIQVQMAGGNPVWLEAAQGSDGWTIVNFEQIARWDPDMIFVVVGYSLDPEKVMRDIKADSHWRALKAVAKNEIHIFPADAFEWDQAEMRWILGINWLATRIHPNRFKGIDIRTEVMTFFSQLYWMKKSEIESGILPKVKLDVR
jgi:iron complex transport system substrate-binding protein